MMSLPLANHNILLGISGGIAAYKTPDLVRKLKAQGANVRVVVTESAKSFVSSLALQAVSGFPVADDLLDPAAEAAMGHIELARWADTLLIAPATANTMAKLAHGLADDLLSTLALATTAPITIAPAMNQQMWQAPATQNNIAMLQQRGITFLGPDQGEQACGEVGPGRMMEPQDIALAIADSHKGQGVLRNIKVVITAGPTREHIDPVRYVSNHSSGKMGFAIADAMKAAGAQVVLVSGPVSIAAPNVDKVKKIETAEEMLDAVMAEITDCDIFIGCAAVADYKPLEAVDQKIKKSNTELTLTFVRNPDILATVASCDKPPFTVGFAAETQNVADYAKDKMARKKLNMIAANDVSQQDIGFNSDQNALTIYWQGGEKHLDTTDKRTLAKQLVSTIIERYQDAQD